MPGTITATLVFLGEANVGRPNVTVTVNRPIGGADKSHAAFCVSRIAFGARAMFNRSAPMGCDSWYGSVYEQRGEAQHLVGGPCRIDFE